MTQYIIKATNPSPSSQGERGGSVVECWTPEREVRGSRPTAAVLCPWARHFTPRKYWLITQEAMAPSRYDWKIVDWDVKPQHNQPNPSSHIPREQTFCFLFLRTKFRNRAMLYNETLIKLLNEHCCRFLMNMWRDSLKCFVMEKRALFPTSTQILESVYVSGQNN